MWEYTDKVREHFINPRNVGEIQTPSGTGDVGSITCGDALKLTLDIDSNNIIKDAKFKTFGCASAIASSSALTEMIIGKSVEEAEKITNDDIVDFLGGLPKEKIHCSVMGQEALQKAIADFKGIEIVEKEGNIVCHCFDITEDEIRHAVAEHSLGSIDDVTGFLKAGGGCGQCHDEIQEIIDEVRGDSSKQKKSSSKLTNLQKIKKIEQALEDDIKPALKKDGGNIELVDVDGNKVVVRLQGACATCVKSKETLKNHVEAKLRQKVAHDLVVEESLL
jgi:NifU-like protein